MSFNYNFANSWSRAARTNSIILIATMIIMGWFSAKDVDLMLTSSDWQTTQAIVTQSKINYGHRGGPDSPWIEFSYQVNGRTYVGDQIDFGQWTYDVPHYLQKYPLGRIVTIYFDPIDPSQAVLNKSGSLLANLFLSAFAWGIAIVTGYYRFLK